MSFMKSASVGEVSDTFDSLALSKTVTCHLRYDPAGGLRSGLVDVEEVYQLAKHHGKLPEDANLNWFIGWAFRQRKRASNEFRFMIVRTKDNMQMSLTFESEVQHFEAVDRRESRKRKQVST